MSESSRELYAGGAGVESAPDVDNDSEASFAMELNRISVQSDAADVTMPDENDEESDSSLDRSASVLFGVSRTAARTINPDFDNSQLVDRARRFRKLCQKTFDYRRSSYFEEHAHAWQEVREELDSIKKDDFVATFVARFQDEKKSTALHYACAGRPPIYVVEALLEMSGQPLERRDEEGNLPLHVAAQYGASFEVVRAVFRLYPQAAVVKNYVGRLPVLLALMSNAQPKIVELLKEQINPSHQTEIDAYLKQWKHLKIFVNPRFKKYSRIPSYWEELHKFLVGLRSNDEYPQMAECIVERVNDDEETLLHIACCLSPPVDAVKMMIEMSRTALCMKNAWGGLPLHCALVRGAAESITTLICQEYPEAVRVRDDFGSFPLHYAVRNRATLAVIELLLDEFPEACRLKNNDGLLPLHVATITGVKDGVLKSLVGRYPNATRSRDNSGSFPVHHALKHTASSRVVEILQKASPMLEETSARAEMFLAKCDVYGIVNSKALRRSTSMAGGIELDSWAKVREEIDALSCESLLAEEVASYCDTYGNTPLHVVCMNRPPVDVVKSLIKMSRIPLQLKNEGEGLPLHCSIRYGASYDVVKVLLDASPESCKAPNDQGKLPFRMAVELNASVEVKQILFDSDVANSKEIEDIAQRARAFRMLCTTVQHESKQQSGDFDPSKTWEVVRDEVLQLKEEASIAKRVAEYPDKDTGMTPLHILCGSPGLPPDVVELLLSLSREPLRTRSKWGRLPLHVALDTGTSDHVLMLLLKAHPDDTKKEDLHDGCLDSLRTALVLGVSVEVIKLLTDASPVPTNDEGISFFESLELDYRKDPLTPSQFADSGRWRTSKRSASQLREEIIYFANSKIRISVGKMKVLINSFFDEYQSRDLGGVTDDGERFDDKIDSKEPKVGNLVSFLWEGLMCKKDPDDERYFLVDKRFFSFLRKMPWRIKEEALFHPGLHDMLNKMIARRYFTFILMADFFVLIAIIVTFHIAVVPDWDGDKASPSVSVAQLSTLTVCICYLILRKVVQILSYAADGIVSLWIKDLWNWLDVSYIILLIVSTTEWGSHSEGSGGVSALVMVTGGMTWLMLLVELRSTTLEFSVFTSGLINVARKLVPFLITTLILLEAFAFVFFVESRRSDEDQECPPTEMVGLESGGHEEVPADIPSFCTYPDAQLKVFAMMVSIEQEDFTDGGRAKMWITVIFAFLFIVILLNVLIAVVNENWDDVQRDGKAVFWQARYAFVNEVDSLGAWTASLFAWMNDAKNGQARALCNTPGWFGVWVAVRSCFCGIIGWVGYVVWLFAGVISLGLLWDNSVRKQLLCRKPKPDAKFLSNEMLREELREIRKEMAIHREEMEAFIKDDIKHEMNSLKNQICMLLQEERAQQEKVTDRVGKRG